MRLSTLLLAATLAMAPLAATAQSGGPTGPTIVTVSGAKVTPNRLAFDKFRDKLAGSKDLGFAKAHAFDLAMLEKLPQHAVVVSYPSWDGAPHRFEGPLLKDVLKAAGVTSGSVFPTALDGYAAEIPVAELDKYAAVLAVKMDGRYMGIGDVGPAWVMYPRDQHPELQAQDDAKWVWGVFLIRAV